MLLQRLKEFIDFKGLSIASFERSVGMSNNSYGKSLKNNKAIGTDKLENILSVYPEINPVWLLTGKGEMIVDNDKNEDATEQKNQKFSQKFSVDKDTLSIEDKLLDLINQKEKEKQNLSQILGYIQAQADIMRAHIASLPPQYSIPLPPSPDSLSPS